MRINPILYGVLVLMVFFGIILGFQSAGIWSVSGKVDASGAVVAPSEGDVNTIKGWMTLEQITNTFNVPMSELIAQFNLPSDTPATTAIKDLESDTFDTTALRTWLESRTVAAEAPQAKDVTPTPAQPVSPTLDAAVAATPAPTEHVAPERTVTGKTTFQELLDWGVSKDTIQEVIGSDLPALATAIKDFVTGKGLEFTAIKAQLQVEVNKTK